MLEELKTFMVVVEQENFTKAGEMIKLSQPSVSLHIKNLEKYFNTTLITRSSRQKNIIITESGRLLYRRAKEIFRLVENTTNELKNISSSLKGHIKIGSSLTIGEYFLPNFLKQFSMDYPDIEIEVIIENTASICEGVRNLKLDFGLIEGIVSSHDFKQEYFLEDSMVLMVPYDHPLTKDEFTYDKLQNLRWISREFGSGTREYLDIFLTTNEIVPRNIMVLGSNYAIKEAVKNGLGVTLISNYVAKEAYKNKEVSIIEVDNSFKRHFSYLISKDISLSMISKVFIESLSAYSDKYDVEK